MTVAHQALTWTTYSGDQVKVYATAEPDEDGGVAIRWHWRRTHEYGRRILARSDEPKKRRRDAVWEARRVNPVLSPDCRADESA